MDQKSSVLTKKELFKVDKELEKKNEPEDTVNCINSNNEIKINLEADKDLTMRCFTRQVANLQLAARKNNIYIIITEQVYTDKNGEIKPFTNRDTEHMIKSVLKLEKTGVGKRQATIIKHRSQPEDKKASFVSDDSTGFPVPKNWKRLQEGHNSDGVLFFDELGEISEEMRQLLNRRIDLPILREWLSDD